MNDGEDSAPASASTVDAKAGKLSGRASAKSLSAEKLAEFSRRVDQFVAAKIESVDEKRNEKISDEIFLRRIYLDAVGRIPNLQETRSFLESKDKNRRQELIDDLLDSYGYTSRQFNFWADTLRLKTRINNSTGQPYIDYVKDSFEQNKPYDEFVHELLTSSGAVLERGNGAVGYYIRDRNMPEDNMSNTVRIFLGTRLECAQCHDHPFDKWTQRQYFEMVAFTGGMNYSTQNIQRKYGAELRRLEAKNPEQNSRLYAITRNFARMLNSGVTGSGTGLARLPEGFLGKDGEEGQIIAAKTMFEGKSLVEPKIPAERRRNSARKRPNNRRQQQIPGASGINSREALADWLTDTENPRFSKVIANRLWKQVFGLGLVEPIDIFEDSTIASNPELLEYLGEMMVELDFDMKQFLRVLYNTRTYQSAVTKTDIIEAQKYAFNGPVMKRMSAEQVWDSMIGLAIDDIDVRRPGNQAGSYRYIGKGEDIYDLYDEVKDKSVTELVEFIQGRLGGAKGMTGSDQMASAKAEQKKNQNAKRQKIKAFQKMLMKAKRQGDDKRVQELMLKRSEYMAKNRPGSNQYVRASELPSPAPAGHFLRDFGQSDREQIDNANTESSVTQILKMMNGFVDEKIGRDQSSVLIRNAMSVPRGPAVVDAIFLTMLNRYPTSRERSEWMGEFRENTEHAYTDLIWTLANCNEFIFVR